MTPRYEYRVWAPDLTEPAGLLAMHCTPLGVRVSEETYVVHPRTDLNIKIRAETLDVKQLVGTQQGFQLWTPILKEIFPLSGSAAAEAMGYMAESPSSAGGTVPLDVDDFLDAADKAGAVVATVAKQRHGYGLEECILEFAEVTIDGFSVHTVAVESEDLDNTVAMAGRLGIDELPNQSYPQEIRLALQL